MAQGMGQGEGVAQGWATDAGAAEIGGAAPGGGFAVGGVQRRHVLPRGGAEHADCGIGGGQGGAGEGLGFRCIGGAGDDGDGGVFQQVCRGEQGGGGGPVSIQAAEGFQHGFGAGAEAGFAGEVMQAGQDFRHQAGAGGGGLVHGAAGAGGGAERDIRRVAGRGEVAAGAGGGEPAFGGGHVVSGLVEAVWFPRCLEQGDGGTGHGGLVFQQAGGGDAAEAPGMGDAAIGLGELVAEEVQRLAGQVDPGGLVEDEAAAAEGGDGERVPVGQDLVVPPRADALGAGG